MSKIICDVCGTSYPETATQCPICGSVRPGDAQVISGEITDPDAVSAGTYQYVKGGRFSKANVRKRNRMEGNVPAAEETQNVEYDEQYEEDEAEHRSNTGLIITAAALLLAIIAVCAYIGIRFFAPGSSVPRDTTPAGTSTEPSQTVAQRIPCTEISLPDAAIELNTLGSAWLLNVKAVPENTTDTITFGSSDTTVATVTSAGKVQAVGSGEATITVSCGNVKTTCKILCTFENPADTTAATEQTEPTTVPPAQTDEFCLNRKDITFSKKGETWVIYNGAVAKTDITWKSENEAVATIENGKVTAVGKGKTTVSATYNGKTVSCIIRCNFADTQSGEAGNTGGESSNTGGESTGTCFISHQDVTVAVGESFNLTLRDANMNILSVTWKAANGAVCTVSGNRVTGAASGKTTTVSATYQGQTYSCIVRVK